MALRLPEARLSRDAAAPRPVEPSDESLAAQAVALSDSRSYDTLMRRHQTRIGYLLLRFTGDRGRAEELSQETFLRAWQKLASFEGRGAFGAWLTRLAYNVFLQDRRRNRNRPATASLDEAGVAIHAAALASQPPSDGLPDLERLLSAVTAEEQRLLVLSYAGGLSAAEIGDMLGTSASTVKSQIHRAKEKIRRRFDIEVAP